MIKHGRPSQHRCSFCGRGEEEVIILVSGMDGQICEVCVEKAQEIIDQELRRAGVQPEGKETPASGKSSQYSGPIHLIPPRDIKTFLDQYVIGQISAKKILAVGISFQDQSYLGVLIFQVNRDD